MAQAFKYEGTAALERGSKEAYSAQVRFTQQSQTQEQKAAEERRQSEIGYFVKFLRQDLKRCQKDPSFVKETEQSLQKYERAYAEAVQKIRGKRDSAPN